MHSVFGTPQEVQDGWRQIEVLHHTRYPPACRQFLGRPENQRHVDVGLIQAMVVVVALMLVQYLAVVGCEDDGRVLLEAQLLKAGEDGP